MADGEAILSFIQAKFAHSRKKEESQKEKGQKKITKISSNHKKVAQGEIRKGHRGMKRGQETIRREKEGEKCRVSQANGEEKGPT